MMQELQQATLALAEALGISGDLQDVPAGFEAPEGWTTLAAAASDGARTWEIGLLVSAATLEALGGQDQGLGTLAEALESQGKIIAGALGATLSEEASLALQTSVQAGAAVTNGDAGVIVVVAGAPVPEQDVQPQSPTGAGAATAPSVVSAGSSDGKLRILSDVEMTVTAELGRAYMTVRELLALTPGAIVELDRIAGTPIDVLVNGTVVARGEVVVVDEEFGVRITEIVDDATA